MLSLTPPQVGDPSPWGPIRSIVPLGPEAAVVTTASHGGIWISAAALARLDPALRETHSSKDGWYEADCDWCIPYLALDLAPHEPDPTIGGGQKILARRMLERLHPDLVPLIDRLRQSEDDDA